MSSSPSGHHDPATAARLELARARSLAAIAATIAHDLNNQFNAALGLAAQLRPLVDGASDRELLTRLEAGTKAGARMVTALARMLSKGPGNRVEVDVSEVVEDALQIVGKSIQSNGIDLQVSIAESLPSVRVVATEACQAVLQGMLALLAGMPGSIGIDVTAQRFAIADGRVRRCVAVRCQARKMVAGSIEPLLVVAGVQPGMLAQIGADPHCFAGLAGAVLIQRRLGGDLLVARLDEEAKGLGVCLTYYWPAVVVA